MTDLRTQIVGLTATVPVIGGTRPYINLDNAASTPPLKVVLETVEELAPWYSSVHRGNGFKSRLSTALYEEARSVVGAFVGADPADHTVIFGKNTTDAINKLSYRLDLRRDDIVLISHLEHHSNDLPWRARATVKRIAILPDGSVDQDDYVRLLARYDARVKLVAISGASNVTGYLPDIHWFARQAHAVGAQIFVDCAQLAAHRNIDMRRLDDPEHLDYVAVSAHKMYAPFGSGALVGRRDTFIVGAPEYTGGGTIASVTTKTIDWAAPPDRDEAGSPNVIGAVALAKAIKALGHIGLERIADHEVDVTAYALSRLKSVQGLTIYGNQSPHDAINRSGVIPFTLKDKPSHLVAACLGFEWGIGVRSGCFCAQPYVMSLLGLDPGRVRNNMLHDRRDTVDGLVRISFGMYNTQAEIDTLVEALSAIAQGKHEKYEVDRASGSYSPADTQERLANYFVI